MRLHKGRETRHDFKHYMRRWEAMEKTYDESTCVHIWNYHEIHCWWLRHACSWPQVLFRAVDSKMMICLVCHVAFQGWFMGAERVVAHSQFFPVFWFLVQLTVEAFITCSTTRELHHSSPAMTDCILSNCHLNKSVHTCTAFVRYLSVMKKYTIISYYKCQINRTKENWVL